MCETESERKRKKKREEKINRFKRTAEYL